jgi:hypothetical protein
MNRTRTPEAHEVVSNEQGPDDRQDAEDDGRDDDRAGHPPCSEAVRGQGPGIVDVAVM